MMEIYLASSSQRRKLLLKQIGITFKRLPIDIDESSYSQETVPHLVKRLALEKALAGWHSSDRVFNKPVMGADTLVVIEDSVLGKPKNKREGVEMLMRLSGKTHRVFSAVALVQDQRQRVKLSVSRVTFRSLSRQEAELYWSKSLEPVDKAGSYGIQGLGSIFVKKICGSYSGIMGLPLMETAELLQEFSVSVLK